MMKRRNIFHFLLTLLFTLGGFVILWQSTTWGLKISPEIIKQLGTISGEPERLAVSRWAGHFFQLTGAILLGTGLYRLSEPLKDGGENHAR